MVEFERLSKKQHSLLYFQPLLLGWDRTRQHLYFHRRLPAKYNKMPVLSKGMSYAYPTLLKTFHLPQKVENNDCSRPQLYRCFQQWSRYSRIIEHKYLTSLLFTFTSDNCSIILQPGRIIF